MNRVIINDFTNVKVSTVSSLLSAVGGKSLAMQLLQLKLSLNRAPDFQFDDVYGVVRLLMPVYDTRHYGLTEYKLGKALCMSQGIDLTSDLGKEMMGWKDLVTQELPESVDVWKSRLFNERCGVPPGEEGLTVSTLNMKLDQLVHMRFPDQIPILGWLMEHTTPSDMRTVCIVIVRCLAPNLEDAFISEFSPDAKFLWNATHDNKHIARKLVEGTAFAKPAVPEPHPLQRFAGAAQPPPAMVLNPDRSAVAVSNTYMPGAPKRPIDLDPGTVDTGRWATSARERAAVIDLEPDTSRTPKRPRLKTPAELKKTFPFQKK